MTMEYKARETFLGRVLTCILAVGDHGYRPQIRKIEKEVEEWLKSVVAAGKKIEYRIRVSCRRIPAAKGFYGIHVINIPEASPGSLELRVRLPKDDYQWQCFVDISLSTVAFEILSKVRPEAVTYVKGKIDQWNKLATESNAGKGPRGAAKVRKNVMANHWDDRQEVKRLISKGSVRDNLCGWLASLGFSQFQHKETVEAAQKTLPATLDFQASSYVVEVMVERGLIEPVGGGAFRPSIVFWECVARFQKLMTEKERQALIIRRAKLEDQAKRATKQRDRHQALSDEAGCRIDAYREEIREIDIKVNPPARTPASR